MNTAKSVNMKSSQRATQDLDLLARLEAIFEEVGWPTEMHMQARRTMKGPTDVVVRVPLAHGHHADLEVHTAHELRPGGFDSWATARRAQGSNAAAIPVLAMPSVSSRLAELCRRAGWSWYDLSGNCWIDIPGVFHFERSGLPPVYRIPRRGASLGTAAASRVLRALLTPAHAGRSWTQRGLVAETCRKIGDAAPVSLGLVNKVVRHLRDEGYVSVTSDRAGIRVRDPLALLAAWRDAYRFDRHERRAFFTLLKGERLEEVLGRLEFEAGGMAAYAAFSAAERQAPHVRQPKTWIYLRAEALRDLARLAQAKEVDSGENLVVLIPDDPGVFMTFEADQRVGETKLHCTDPVQTYVDLSRCGGRGEEAAEAILEQRILPKWKDAGLVHD